MSQPRVSIITPTARYGGIDIAWSGLRSQSIKSFEWIIVDEIKRGKEVERYTKDTRVRHIMSPPKRAGMFWNLSKALNHGIKHAHSDIIIVLQDYIYLPSHALEHLLRQYEKTREYGNEIVMSGVGHKFIIKDRTVVRPKDPISVYEKRVDGLMRRDLEMYEEDPRSQGRGLHVCNPIEWEGNYGVFSYNLAKKIGGFDEDFDAGWGYDNVNFAERAQAAGAWIWLDETDEIFSISHENVFKEQDFKDGAPNNEKLWERKLQEIKDGKWKAEGL